MISSPGRSLLDQVGFEQELEELVGRPVDVVAEGGISPYLETEILRGLRAAMKGDRVYLLRTILDCAEPGFRLHAFADRPRSSFFSDHEDPGRGHP